MEGSATSTIVASRRTMKKAPQSSASAVQRRGSGVFSTSPPLRGADVISGLSLVSMCPPGCHLSLSSVETPARPTRLGLPDARVGEGGEAVTDGPCVEEAHGLLVAGLPEEALAGPEHDRVDHQPQLVHQVVLHQRGA